jgi:hypothetical protein
VLHLPALPLPLVMLLRLPALTQMPQAPAVGASCPFVATFEVSIAPRSSPEYPRRKFF